jgi:uncharacterized protein
MRLDISEALREVGSHVPYNLNVPPLVDEDIECTQPITGTIAFTNTGGTLLIRGQANTAVALPCSRCIEYFERPVTLAIEEQFELRRTAGPRTVQTVEVLEEDESPIAAKLFEGQTFDLSEMLRQYLVLEQPTKPLPPQTPEGRCAHCHRRPDEVLQKLTESHEPEEPPVNPALAKLGELLNKKK